MTDVAKELAERIVVNFAIQKRVYLLENGEVLPESGANELLVQLITSALQPQWVSVQTALPEKSDIKWRSTWILAVMRLTGNVKALEYKEHDSGGWYFFDGKWPYEEDEITLWQKFPVPPAPPAEETNALNS